MSNLLKSIRAAKRRQRDRHGLVKAFHFGAHDLEKGVHDAMFHHAECARAAEMAGKSEIGKAHTFMFLRHALENARKANSMWGMIHRMRAGVDFYQGEADASVPYSVPGADGKHQDADLVKYFKDGGEFKPHADDKHFTEDYRGKKPKV